MSDLYRDGSRPGPTQSQQKRPRKRIVLSCSFCRSAKLKCDRKSPCSQCERRGLPAQDCVYVPLPDKMRKSRSVATRLKELEGTVRGLMNDASRQRPTSKEQAGGRVVFAEEGKGTYVGATHFMTILDDLEDLKQFFDESDGNEEDPPSPQAAPSQAMEMWMLSESSPRGKKDLVDLFPPLQVLSRLVMRFFAWRSPVTSIIHRPSFNRQYHAFLQDHTQASYEFLALLFAILAEATLFSIFASPQEIAADSPVPPMERFKSYRSATVWALTAADYLSPSIHTIPPLLLNLEAEFVLTRSTPMACYLLSSSCIRLMLRLGLHRDPSKLPNITPFQGEMRRRMWHLGLQVEMLVSFQMGLPSMAYGIESDTELPRNLKDEDFDEDTTELPPGLANHEQGPLTYFIWKTSIGRVFGMIVKQTNSLTQATEAETLRLDKMLEEVWRQVPAFLNVRPLEECVTDDPRLVLERFSLSSLYYKGQCVLHRQYLAEDDLGPDHSYSRSTCLRAALALLDYQKIYHIATAPNGMLAPLVWFFRPLLMGNFLLAAMIVYISVQSRGYPDNFSNGHETPSKRQLCAILSQSGSIWATMAETEPVYRKAANILATMVAKARTQNNDGDSAADRLMAPSHEGSTPAKLSDVCSSDQNELGIPTPAMDSHYVPSLQQGGVQGTPMAAMANEFDSAPWLSFGDNIPVDWQIIDEAMRMPKLSETEMPAEWSQSPFDSSQERLFQELGSIHLGVGDVLTNSFVPQ